MERPSSRKPITGFHVTLMFVAFFGVIAAVNFLMASFAVSSFGGTVVDNSYVASQKYNEWLEQARQQKAYGWTIGTVERTDGKAVITIAGSDGQALRNASVSALVDHPVGRAEPFELAFEPSRSGEFASTAPLPNGRWKLKFTIAQGEKVKRVTREIR